ncbi:hypothetical protein CZ794_01890 [Psychrobacter sp. JB385]|nr:hypothetical protein CZ794_01890 [Psychrobacter sp. JB385]
MENAQNLTKTWSNLLGLGMIASALWFDKNSLIKNRAA